MPKWTGTRPSCPYPPSMFSKLPSLPTCPPPGGAGKYCVRIPEVYSSYRPQITIYPPTIAEPYHTLETLFPLPPNIVPRSFLDFENGRLTVLFRKLEGPHCKGGPGRRQQMATYEIVLSKQWLEGGRDWEASVVTIEDGKEKDQKLEETNSEETEEEEEKEEGEKGYRVVFFGKDDRHFSQSQRRQNLPWAGPAREKGKYQFEDMEVIEEEEEEEETSSEKFERTTLRRTSPNRFVID